MDKKMEKVLYDVSEYALIVGGAEIGLTQFTSFSIMDLLAGVHDMAVPIAAGVILASAAYQLYIRFMKK